MYAYILDTLVAALMADGCTDLLEVLQQRLLPVLAVCRESLSVEELVWATGAQPDQVGTAGWNLPA